MDDTRDSKLAGIQATQRTGSSQVAVNPVEETGPSTAVIDLSSSATSPSSNPPLVEEAQQGTGSTGESRSSITGAKRNGSVAGNERSAQGESLGAGAAGQSTTATGPVAVNRLEKKRKGVFLRLLSKLTCCGVSEDANAIDLDEHAIPARMSSKLQATPAKQTNPVKKPDMSAAESTTTESKEMTEEKIGGPPYSALKSAGEPRIQEQPNMDTERASANNYQVPAEDNETGSATQLPIPKDVAQSMGTQLDLSLYEGQGNDLQPALLQGQGAAVIVEPPIPITSVQENAINDRTLLQEKRDSDIEMTDAPPDEPRSTEPRASTERIETGVVPPLPPPPPLATRIDNSSPGHERSLPNNTNTPTEQQKWLLPTMKPEFNGKKCLVLDLDETLVHSSFKVCGPTLVSYTETDVYQILHQADFTIPVEIEGQDHNVYVIKRPGVDQFMKRVGELYEVVVFTASVSKVIILYCSSLR